LATVWSGPDGAEQDDSCDHGDHGDHAGHGGHGAVTALTGRVASTMEGPSDRGGARTPRSDPGSGPPSERNRLRPAGGAPTTPPSHLRPRGRKPTRESWATRRPCERKSETRVHAAGDLLPPFRRHSLSSARRAAVSGRRKRHPAAGAPARCADDPPRLANSEAKAAAGAPREQRRAGRHQPTTARASG
jgi:hypothetical protein